MPRARPFLFCRYSMLVDENHLDERAQLLALQDLQGQLFAHGLRAEREGRRDTILMRPRSFLVDDRGAISWSVGHRIDIRVAAKYDEASDRLDLVAIDDGTVRYNDIVAVPSLGVLAVDDRTGDRHIGGKPAIARLRSIFQNVEGGSVNIERLITSSDLERALESWELDEVSFKVRPVNPHTPSDLSRQLSEAMKREHIGTLRAVAKPAHDQQMRPSDGPIGQATALSNEGYGQVGVRGRTPEGHMATIPRPQFDLEKRKNEKIQSKPREFRVFIEADSEVDETIFFHTAKALVSFYDR